MTWDIRLAQSRESWVEEKDIFVMAPPVAACGSCNYSHFKFPHCGMTMGSNYYLFIYFFNNGKYSFQQKFQIEASNKNKHTVPYHSVGNP